MSSGRFTRSMYDSCALQQNVKQSTEPLDFILDSTKFVNCNNLCKPTSNIPYNPAFLVDVESSLWGLDKMTSKCDTTKYPFCSTNGCLVGNDPRIPAHITPYACERGYIGENVVITTNMKKPTNPGFSPTSPLICPGQLNGYYTNYNMAKNIQLIPLRK